jgi:hypothetical protein
LSISRNCMLPGMHTVDSLKRLVSILHDLLLNSIRLLLLGSHSKAALKAENTFLRKQLALYLERKVKPRRANRATRLTLVLLSRLLVLPQSTVGSPVVTYERGIV